MSTTVKLDVVRRKECDYINQRRRFWGLLKAPEDARRSEFAICLQDLQNTWGGSGKEPMTKTRADFLKILKKCKFPAGPPSISLESADRLAFKLEGLLDVAGEGSDEVDDDFLGKLRDIVGEWCLPAKGSPEDARRSAWPWGPCSEYARRLKNLQIPREGSGKEPITKTRGDFLKILEESEFSAGSDEDKAPLSISLETADRLALELQGLLDVAADASDKVDGNFLAELRDIVDGWWLPGKGAPEHGRRSAWACRLQKLQLACEGSGKGPSTNTHAEFLRILKECEFPAGPPSISLESADRLASELQDLLDVAADASDNADLDKLKGIVGEWRFPGSKWARRLQDVQSTWEGSGKEPITKTHAHFLKILKECELPAGSDDDEGPPSISLESADRLASELQNLLDVAADASDEADRDSLNELKVIVDGLRRLAKEEKLPDDLVGLALSGGGLKSACFGAGVLDAMDEAGLSKGVDYVSTVSGGSYVGAYRSSCATARAKQRTGAPCKGGECDASRRSPVLDSVPHAGYWRTPWRFFGKYALSATLNSLVLLSFLVAACAFAAWFWRLLDARELREQLGLLQLNWDVYAAFLPVLLLVGLGIGGAIICLLMWLVAGFAWPGTFCVRRVGCFLWLVAVTFLMGIGIILGNGGTSLGVVPPVLIGYLNEISGQVRPLMAGIIASGALLPVLRPAWLRKQLKRGEGAVPRWFLRAASVAAGWGIPFLVFFAVARENCSGYATYRDPDLLRWDVKNWYAFHEWIEAAAGEAPQPGTAETHGPLAHLTCVRDATFPPVESSPTEERGACPLSVALRGLRKCTREVSKRQKELDEYQLDQRKEKHFRAGQRSEGPRWTWADKRLRLWWMIQWPLGGSPFERYWQQKLTADALKDGACVQFSSLLLSSPEFYQLLVPDGTEDHWSRVDEVVQELQDQELWGREELQDSQRGLQVRTGFSGAKELCELWRAFSIAGPGRVPANWTKENLKHMNRLLLEACHPELVQERSTVYRRIVIAKDQQWRWWLGAIAFAVFLVAASLIDVNWTSMHASCREAMADSFVCASSDDARPGTLKLSHLRATDQGAPYHLMMASVRRFGRLRVGRGRRVEGRSGPGTANGPGDSGTEGVGQFLFSRAFCGAQSMGFAPTDRYEKGLPRGFGLADAAALSGATLSPGCTDLLALELLIFAANLRQAQWLPHPGHRGAPERASFSRVARRWIRTGDYRSVSSGAHYEELGILPLLERQCSLIIAVDATYDPDYEFDDLAQTIRLAKARGIRFRPADETGHSSPTSPHALHLPMPLMEVVEFERKATTADESASEAEKPKANWISGLLGDRRRILRLKDHQHYRFIKVEYANAAGQEPKTGLLVYLKAAVSGDEEFDVLHYQEKHSSFPQEGPTGERCSKRQAEAYRQLGYHVALSVVGLLKEKLQEERPPAGDGLREAIAEPSG